MTIQLPVPTDSAQPREIPASAGMTGEEAGMTGARYSIFSPQAQGAFLENLAHSGNVRLACKVARVSPQTAYRARRRSAALARAWDAALLSARHNAEEVLADRALNGWEEAVFYHGEEVAVRRRYSDRLLLAHLARLDRLAERADVADALAALDDQIEALQRGEELPEPPPENLDHNPVPCVPSGRENPPSSNEVIGRKETPSSNEPVGQTKTPSSSGAVGQKESPTPEPCDQCGGLCNGPEHALTQADCQWFGNRLNRMWDARPRGAQTPYQLGDTTGFIEELQIEAFEADLPEWWLITSEEALDAALESALSPS